jgi:hypothetical protein
LLPPFIGSDRPRLTSTIGHYFISPTLDLPNTLSTFSVLGGFQHTPLRQNHQPAHFQSNTGVESPFLLATYPRSFFFPHFSSLLSLLIPYYVFLR